MVNFKAEQGQDLEGDQFRKLFIGGITVDTTDDGLKQFYEQWGEVVDCIVMRDSATRRSRGFGFVTFSSAAALDLAMTNRPHVIDGKQVDPKRAIPRDMSHGPDTNKSVTKLYVSQVREDHSEEQLRDYFGEYGAVEEVVIHTKTDPSTGAKNKFAFVTFDDYDAVDKCVLRKSHMINGKRCDVKKALSKEELRQAQQQERERNERYARSRGTARRGGYEGGAPSGRGGGGARGYGGGDWAGYGGGGDYGYGGGGGGGWDYQGGWSQPPAAAYGGYGQAGYAQPQASAAGWNQGWNPQSAGWGPQGAAAYGQPHTAYAGYGAPPQPAQQPPAPGQAPQGWQNQG